MMVGDTLKKHHFGYLSEVSGLYMTNTRSWAPKNWVAVFEGCQLSWEESTTPWKVGTAYYLVWNLRIIRLDGEKDDSLFDDLVAEKRQG